MKIAYLIIAHNNPRHLEHLISTLSSDATDFFVHIDKKSDMALFSNIKDARVHFIEDRVPVFWADFSQIDATLALVRAAIAHENHFDRLVLLSGGDYPIRSVNYIQQFFTKFPEKEFINVVAMPADAVGKPISRLTTYRPRSTNAFVIRAYRKVLKMAGSTPQKRDYKAVFGTLSPYAGSQWWALSRAACEHILTFTVTEPAVVNFFKNTDCPDESFFQTILGNSRFKGRIVRSLTYADWSDGGSSPNDISESSLAMFRDDPSFKADNVYGSGEILFARKFNDQSDGLVDQLDRQIEAQEKLLATNSA